MSSLAELAVVALNGANVGIAGAAFNDSTHTLTAASIADGIGDHELLVEVYPPATDAVSPNAVKTAVGYPVPGFVATIVDGGVAGAVLTAVLAADTYGVPSLLVKAKASE